MAISDEMWIIGIGLLFNYLIMYKKNRFLGNIIFSVLGLILMSYSTGNINSAVGLILLLIGIGSLFYDTLTPNKKK